MKKIILCLTCIMAIVLLSGCSMDNTPTKKVENFLDNYKNHDETVLNQLQEMVNSDGLMDETQKNTYSDIMKKQYEDMTYEIKDEVIDGDTATVTAEIEVYDYYKINQDSQNYYNANPGEFTETITDTTGDGIADDVVEGAENAVEGATDAIEGAVEGVTDGTDNTTTQSADYKYVEYRLGQLQNAQDRVKYTIDFTLTKVEEVWTLNDIDDMTRQKIHGLYEH